MYALAGQCYTLPNAAPAVFTPLCATTFVWVVAACVWPPSVPLLLSTRMRCLRALVVQFPVFSCRLLDMTQSHVTRSDVCGPQGRCLGCTAWPFFWEFGWCVFQQPEESMVWYMSEFLHPTSALHCGIIYIIYFNSCTRIYLYVKSLNTCILCLVIYVTNVV